MTNLAVATVVHNSPNFTHFHLCIMGMCEPEYLTNEPMDEAFGVVIKLQSLAVSGLLTNRAFVYIGTYAMNLEALSVVIGACNVFWQDVLKLQKLEISDCRFGNAALLSGIKWYEPMSSLWMSAYNVTMHRCRLLAREMPRLNVEVIKED